MDLITDVIERQEKLESMRDSQKKRSDERREKAKESECESLDPRLSGSSSGSNGGSEDLSTIAFRKQSGRNVANKRTESDEGVTTPCSETNKEGSGRDSSSGYGEDDLKQPKKLKGSTDKSESTKDGLLKNSKQVKIKILGLEAWQLTYVRTRNNSLRCFPACRPVHRERSFCGLPITIVVDAGSETEARQMVVLGAFRKVKTDVIQINDKFSTVELTRMLGTDFIIGTLVSYDKKSKQAKFKLGPPRKWRYVANTLSSTELHTFTIYAFTQAGGRCVARQDSPFFTIVPAWRQSATEITARRSDSDSKSTSDVRPLAHPKDAQSPPGQVMRPFHPHLPPYPVFRPHRYDPYSSVDESWEPGNVGAQSGLRKKRRIPSAHMKRSDGYMPPPPGYYVQSPMSIRPPPYPPYPHSLSIHSPEITSDASGTAMTRYPWSGEDVPPPDYTHFDPRWGPSPYLPSYNPYYGWARPPGSERISMNESSSGEDAASTESSKSSERDTSKTKKRKAGWPRHMMAPQNLALDASYHRNPPPPYMSGHYYPPIGSHPFPPNYPQVNYPPNDFQKQN